VQWKKWYHKIRITQYLRTPFSSSPRRHSENPLKRQATVGLSTLVTPCAEWRGPSHFTYSKRRM